MVDPSTEDSDVANLYVTSGPAAGSLMQNIETVNVTLGDNADLEGRFTGYTAFNISATSDSATATLNTIDGETPITIAGSTVFGSASEAANLTVDAAAGASSVDVVLEAGGTTDLDIDGGSATEFAVVNLTSNGDAKNTVALATGTDREQSGDEFVIDGDADFELIADLADMGAADGAAQAVIDASAATGEVTYAAQDATSSDFDLDATEFTGVDVVALGAAGNVGLQGANIVSGLESGMAVDLRGDADSAGGDDLTVSLADASAGDDALTVRMNDQDTSADLEFDDLTTTGIETVTIDSTGVAAASSVATPQNSINSLITTTTNSKLVITGGRNLVVDGDVDELFTDIDASATTGTVDLTMATNAADTTFVGSDQDDRFDVQGQLTSADSLDGGEGTDTLVIGGVANDTASTEVLGSGDSANTAGFTNFEVLELNDALDIKTGDGDVTVSLTNVEGMNSLKLSNAVTTDTSENETFTVKADSGVTLTLAHSSATIGDATAEDGGFVIDVTDAQTAGTDDVVNLVLNNGSGDVTEEGFQIDGVETLNITQEDNHASNADTIADIHGAQLTSITFTGAETAAGVAAQKIVMADAETSSLDTLDGSNFEGALDVSALSDDLAATGATITGGTGSLTATGGAGGDRITGNESADVVFGGDGLDTISVGAGGDTVYGGGGAATKESLTEVVNDETFASASDKITLTIFGKDVVADASGSADSGDEIADLLVSNVQNDSVLSKLVDISSVTSGDEGTITVTSKVDGNFTNFGLAEAGGVTALSGESTTDGSSDSDGVDTITVGAGADFIVGGAGADEITLAEDDAADEIVILASGEFGDVITGFEAGTNGGDVLRFANDLFDNGTSTTTLKSVANDGAVGTNDIFIEITTATAAGGADTAAEIESHLSSLDSSEVGSSNEEVLFAVNDGTDTYLWRFDEDSTTGVQAAELGLVGTLNGVTDIANGDLALL